LQKLTTCLMFVGDQFGRAEEAMNLYVSLFENSRVLEIERYGANEEDREGTVKRATFSLAGQEFIAMDSGEQHHFTFTPAMSIFVDYDREQELDEVYSGLSDGGMVLMPLQEYPFSDKFAWLNDRYGVSWQLNLRPK
jgi:predicted 3-demethylubiquinone-9 3-methyltransferase (glyoxalase superfamily)